MPLAELDMVRDWELDIEFEEVDDMLSWEVDEVLLSGLNVEPEEREGVDKSELLVTEVDKVKVELLHYTC